MITLEDIEISQESATYLHKYGDAMSEYMDLAYGSGRLDGEFTGDSDYGWAILKGKRILFGTSTGFVDVTRYDTAELAESEFHHFDNEYRGLIEIGICSDCLQYEANGTLPDDPTERSIIENAYALGEQEMTLGDCDDGCTSFSRAPCGRCGNPLAGERHQAFIWPTEERD